MSEGVARPLLFVALTLAIVAGGCSREESGGGGTDPPDTTDTSNPVSTSSTNPGTTTPASTEAPPTEPPVTEAPVTETTLEEVTSEIVGNAVGGNSGGEGSKQTVPLSETVRNPDGTCSGKQGPDEVWTQGLESGAPVVFLAFDSDVQIGTGQIGTSAWEDVDPSGNEQWNCTFPFTGTIEGNPESFRIKVADLDPWVARRDATNPALFVASVNTEARVGLVEECAPARIATDLGAWPDVVGSYWSDGVRDLCQAGLVVVDLERPCRPPDFASDHIVAVHRADDPAIVLADAGGDPDPATLEPLTEVIVHITTGRPC